MSFVARIFLNCYCVQAYGLGSKSQSKAREAVQGLLAKPETAVIPICLVSDRHGDQDYHQFGFNEVNLQVGNASSVHLSHPLRNKRRHCKLENRPYLNCLPPVSCLMF